MKREGRESSVIEKRDPHQQANSRRKLKPAGEAKQNLTKGDRAEIYRK